MHPALIQGGSAWLATSKSDSEAPRKTDPLTPYRKRWDQSGIGTRPVVGGLGGGGKPMPDAPHQCCAFRRWARARRQEMIVAETSSDRNTLRRYTPSRAGCRTGGHGAEEAAGDHHVQELRLELQSASGHPTGARSRTLRCRERARLLPQSVSWRTAPASATRSSCPAILTRPLHHSQAGPPPGGNGLRESEVPRVRSGCHLARLASLTQSSFSECS